MSEIVQNKIKRLWHPIWDSQRYAAAGQTELRFFQDPLGAAVTGAHTNAVPKKLVDTNMRAGGRLNRGRMQVQGVRVKIKPTSYTGAALPTNALDIAIIQQTGTLRVTIGDSKKIEQQLLDFNSGLGVAGFMASATAGALNAGAATNGVPDVGNFWKLFDCPFDIAPDQTIEAVMEWPAAAAITTAAVITLQFEGKLDSEIVA